MARMLTSRPGWLRSFALVTLLGGGACAGAPSARTADAVAVDDVDVLSAKGDFDGAAAALEARADPATPEGTALLRRAALLRLGLGQDERVRADLERLIATSSETAPEIVLSLVHAVASREGVRGAWAEACARLQAATPLEARAGVLAASLRHDAALGACHAAGNADAEADRAYGRVIERWEAAAPTVRPPAELVADALARAWLHRSRQLRAAAQLPFPTYEGGDGREEVLRFVRGDVVDWVKRKRPLLEAARAPLRALASLGPAAPTMWTVLFEEEAASLQSEFVGAFRAAEIPERWKGHGLVPGARDRTYDDVRGEFLAMLDEISEPEKRQARAQWGRCVEVARTRRAAGAMVDDCEAWLAWMGEPIVPVRLSSMSLADALERTAEDVAAPPPNTPEEAFARVARLLGGGAPTAAAYDLAARDVLAVTRQAACVARAPCAPPDEERLALASALVEAGLMLSPEHARLHVTAALVSLARGDVGGALDALATARRKDPSAPAAAALFAALSVETRDFRGAEVAYGQASLLRPEDPALPIGAARAARLRLAATPDRATEDVLALERVHDDLVRRFPDDPALHLERAKLLWEVRLGASPDARVERAQRAKLAFERFQELASGRPDLEDEVVRARDAVADIEATIAFVRASP